MTHPHPSPTPLLPVGRDRRSTSSIVHSQPMSVSPALPALPTPTHTPVLAPAFGWTNDPIEAVAAMEAKAEAAGIFIRPAPQPPAFHPPTIATQPPYESKSEMTDDAAISSSMNVVGLNHPPTRIRPNRTVALPPRTSGTGSTTASATNTTTAGMSTLALEGKRLAETVDGYIQKLTFAHDSKAMAVTESGRSMKNVLGELRGLVQGFKDLILLSLVEADESLKEHMATSVKEVVDRVKSREEFLLRTLEKVYHLNAQSKEKEEVMVNQKKRIIKAINNLRGVEKSLAKEQHELKAEAKIVHDETAVMFNQLTKSTNQVCEEFRSLSRKYSHLDTKHKEANEDLFQSQKEVESLRRQHTELQAKMDREKNEFQSALEMEQKAYDGMVAQKTAWEEQRKQLMNKISELQQEVNLFNEIKPAFATAENSNMDIEAWCAHIGWPPPAELVKKYPRFKKLGKWLNGPHKPPVFPPEYKDISQHYRPRSSTQSTTAPVGRIQQQPSTNPNRSSVTVASLKRSSATMPQVPGMMAEKRPRTGTEVSPLNTSTSTGSRPFTSALSSIHSTTHATTPTAPSRSHHQPLSQSTTNRPGSMKPPSSHLPSSSRLSPSTGTSGPFPMAPPIHPLHGLDSPAVHTAGTAPVKAPQLDEYMTDVNQSQTESIGASETHPLPDPRFQIAQLQEQAAYAGFGRSTTRLNHPLQHRVKVKEEGLDQP